MRQCIRCHTMISQQAQFCPVCGAQQPLPGQTYNPQTQIKNTQPPIPPQGRPTTPPSVPQGNKSNAWVWGLVAFLGAAVLGLGGWLIYDHSKSADQAATTVSVPVSAPSKSSQENTTIAKSSQENTTIAKSAQEQDVTTENQSSASRNSSETSDRATSSATTNQQSSARSLNGSFHLTGAIDKYPITMDITITDGEVSGTYYYHSSGSNNRMRLSGYTLANGGLCMEEYAPSGSNTGSFDGHFDGTFFSGNFTNYARDSHLHFSLNTSR